MTPIERRLASITEDRRAAYLFNTQLAADAVGCERRKFADWWYRTQRKLIALYLDQPGELAAELAALIALAEAERSRRNGEGRNDAGAKADRSDRGPLPARARPARQAI